MASTPYRRVAETLGNDELGLGTMLHSFPFQCSVSVRLPVTVGGTPGLYSPTDQMSVADTAETPFRALARLPLFGLGTVPHIKGLL